MKRTAVAALACLTLALATYLVYRASGTLPGHHGPVLGPHYVPHLNPGPARTGHGPAYGHPAGQVGHSYTVRAGDCLWTIGRRLHVPWRTLAVANRVHTPYLIHPGQVLDWR